jgi:uncharacterized protein (TIRG00374 family)
MNETHIQQTTTAPGAGQPGTFDRIATLIKKGRLAWLLLPVLLWWSLKDVPFQAVRQSLGQLQEWQVAVLFGLNLLIFLLISGCWWLILQSNGHRMPFWRLTAYRLAGFALSYFTPGPQVGGEPLQVLLLTRRHQIPSAAAISSVFMDKLIELLSNFAFLVLGLLVISAAGLAAGSIPIWVLPLVSLLSMAAHLALLWQGKTRFTWLAHRLAQKFPHHRMVQSIKAAIQPVEAEMLSICHSSRGFILKVLSASLLVGLGLLGEFALMLWFVGLPLNLAQVILALTLARLAFLVPLPGGLGALEASQVLSMKLLGFSPALGISLCLIIRARDLILGGTGLGLWAWTTASE